MMKNTPYIPMVLLAFSLGTGCVPPGEWIEEDDDAFSVPKGNLTKNPSFESNLAGWEGWQATLARVALGGAPEGGYVVRVTSSGGDAFTLDDEPASIPSAVGGQSYAASAWARAASASSRGKTVTLKVRELSPSGTLVKEWVSAAVRLTDDFQRLQLTATALSDGDSLDIRISHGAAGPGDAFEADLVTLVPVSSVGRAEERPFDPAHPVYQPIPANCPLYVHSNKIVNLIASKHAGFGIDVGAESPAVYIGEPSDPVWNLSIQGKLFKVHAPDNIRQGTGADYPIVILDRSSPAYNGYPVEYRLWQASLNKKTRRVDSNGGGVGVYSNRGERLNDIAVQDGKVRRALGMAEIYGQNTGSGNSYTVGMIRPVDIRRGRIDHAIRVAIGYPHPERWFWPATRTETWAAKTDANCPMGCRIFLDKSVDVEALANRVAARLSNEKNKAFARLIVRALQEYGMIALDGTKGNNNIYMEGDATAKWESLIGPKNDWGTYNHVARAIAAELPWRSLRVADGSVFEKYAR